MIVAPLPKDAAIGVYIHVPFCSHICPYCDFTTYAGKDNLIPEYTDAVLKELDLRAHEVRGRDVASIYLGGGTPNLLSPDDIGRMISGVKNSLQVLPNAEITMEANPNGLSLERLAKFRAAGVNRLSIGAQTLDYRGLRTLGRMHQGSEVINALTAASAVGFERVSLDLIFGWPGQKRGVWLEDLRTMVETNADHLSLYSLIVEPGTPYAEAQARGILHMPDDDATADMYEDAIRILGDAGWDHYEIANWSRDADGHSVHNAIYWQHGDYLGLGAGAFGTLDGMRVMNQLLPERYIADLQAGVLPQSNTEQLDESTARAETMMLGLRLLNDGVNKAAFQARHGESLQHVFGEQIQHMIELGMIESTTEGVRLTHRGMMLANDVVTTFL